MIYINQNLICQILVFDMLYIELSGIEAAIYRILRCVDHSVPDRVNFWGSSGQILTGRTTKFTFSGHLTMEPFSPLKPRVPTTKFIGPTTMKALNVYCLCPSNGADQSGSSHKIGECNFELMWAQLGTKKQLGTKT